MATLAQLLPKPTHSFEVQDAGSDDDEAQQQHEEQQHKLRQQHNGPPPYGQRRNFVPVDVEDFGDGGAFPEINVLQYPLNMGRRDASKGSKTVAVKTDADGKVQYDLIVRQGAAAGKIVYSKHSDLAPKEADEEALRRPSEEDAKKTAARTAAALGALVDKAVSSSHVANIRTVSTKEPTYVRYTPSEQHAAHNSGAQQRIIRLQEAPIDPLEPPKFKHQKLPAGPPSPPAPVLHSPTRKLTAEDAANWKIPPSVSAWKNPKGFVIALDKRLANDGRNLQDVQLGSKHATFSEALFQVRWGEARRRRSRGGAGGRTDAGGRACACACARGLYQGRPPVPLRSPSRERGTRVHTDFFVVAFRSRRL